MKTKEKVEIYLRKLYEEKEYWEHAVIHSRWIDDGKGGCVRKDIKLIETNAKIDAIKFILIP